LLSWLSIANQCDINYKSSKNQRLLVELALMKMAHVQSVLKGNGAAPTQEGLKKKVN
jgi:DNA polymerase-3 subunit gamma/tau